MKRILFGFSVLVLCVYQGHAQTSSSCAQTLRLARSTYEQGRLHELPTLLDGCLKNGFTTQEKVDALKLLTQTYIYLEEPEKADEAMLDLLRTDSYYKPNELVDPAEFVALFRTFRSDPIYRIGAKLGVAYSTPNVAELVTAVELASDSEFKPMVGFQFGIAADIPVTKKMTLHADLVYLQNRFEIDEKVDRGLDPNPFPDPTVINGEPRTNSFTGPETQTTISLPVMLEYNFLNEESKFHDQYKPYVSLGVGTNYILNANINSERNRADQTSIPKSGIDVEREKLNFSGILGAGIKTKIASGLLVFELRYTYGITNVSSQENAYANQKLLWDYGYANPIFKMNSLGITVSYVQDIFNPKKLTPKK